MENKYKNLRNFENNIVKPLILRIVKNIEITDKTKLSVRSFFRDSIDKVNLPNEVVEDILMLICDIGSIEKDFLIKEIYESMLKSKGISYENTYKYISEISPYKLLTNPIDRLLVWYRTIKGSDFYEDLCENVNEYLNTVKILYNLTHNE